MFTKTFQRTPTPKLKIITSKSNISWFMISRHKSIGWGRGRYLSAPPIKPTDVHPKLGEISRVQLFTCICISANMQCPSAVLAFAIRILRLCSSPPQWGAADSEIKAPSGENTELKRSPFKAWSRSVYRHICYAYCQGFLPCLFLPFRSIHLHFFQKLLPIFSCVGYG